MTNLLTRALFLILVVGGGLAIGILTAPGAWYAALIKPPFNPPNWLFGPVWTVLYILIAMTGWRVWEAGRPAPLMPLWWGQLGLNFLWSPAFFVLQNPVLALLIILPLFAVIVVFIRTAWTQDRLSALAFLPYAAWVAFASLLNFSIVLLN